MLSGHGFEVGGCGEGPGQQLIEAALRVSLDYAGDGVGEVSERLDDVVVDLDAAVVEEQAKALLARSALHAASTRCGTTAG